MTGAWDEEWYKIIHECIREEWQPFFIENKALIKNTYKSIYRNCSYRLTTPRGIEIFSAFEWTDPNNIRVIIVGQDPYPQLIKTPEGDVTRAMGAAFSLRKHDPNAVSLDTIYRELEDSVEGFVKPNHGDLESWAKQGVFLLNKSLTTVINTPNAHSGKWDEFVSRVIEYVEQLNPYVCYILWGKEAQKIPAGNKHMKFMANHPAARNGGFLGCNHFNKVNKYLESKGLEPIDWTSICYRVNRGSPTKPTNSRTGRS
jgi:uracil-DNA glycosylase